MNTPTIALRQDLQVKEVAVKDVDMDEEGFRRSGEGRRDP